MIKCSQIKKKLYSVILIKPNPYRKVLHTELARTLWFPRFDSILKTIKGTSCPNIYWNSIPNYGSDRWEY